MRKFVLFLYFSLSVACTFLQAQGEYIPKKIFRLSEVPPEVDIEPDMIVVKLKSNQNHSFGRVLPVGIGKLETAINGIESYKVFPGNRNSNSRQLPARFKYDLSNIYKIRLQPGENMEARINQLRQMAEVEYAEPCYQPKALLVPNDPDAQGGASQDYLEVIKAYQAWNVERGDSSVTIAVLDSGSDYLHEDLKDNIQYNHADPINGVDDDMDGFVDNYIGWDFADNDNDPSADLDKHGTNVSGLSATTNNGLGLAGVGYDCRFLPIKIFKSSDNSFFRGYEAIVYAAEQGADVINLSWGAPSVFSSFEQDIINHAVLDLNAVIVAAAGNTPLELEFYPASYDNVLSVGASQVNDNKTAFTTFSNFIDLMAPGDAVYTTTNNDDYRFAQGTSFSSPMVAGAAALLKSRFPELTAPQIMEKIRVNADPVDHLPANQLFSERLGKGRLNIHKALIDQSSPSVRMMNFNYSNGVGEFAFFGDTLTIEVDMINYLTPTQNAFVKLSTGSPYITVIDSVFDIGQLNTLQTTSNSGTPFRVVLSPSTPVNTELKFRLGIEDGFYQDYQYFKIQTERDYVTLENDNWGITVSSGGNLGFDEDVFIGGTGLRFGSEFIANQIGFLHTNGDGSVSDNVVKDFIGDNREQDFQALKNIRLTNGAYADLELKAEFRDFSKNDVHVENKTLMWTGTPDDEFMLLEYRLSNISGTDISNLRSGLFIDTDLENNTVNRVDFDNSRNMIYAYDYMNDLYVGLALIEGINPIGHAIDIGDFNGNSSDYGNTFEKAEKITALTVQENQAGTLNNGNDIGILISGSETVLGANQSTVFTFAVVGGASLAELQTRMDMAVNKYTLQKANPSVLGFFTVCESESAMINPAQGDQYEFYGDKELSTLLFTGDELLTGPLTQDTSFYVVNIDSLYKSEVFRIDVEIATPNVNFSMSVDTLFIDEYSDFKVQFEDHTTNAIAWEWNFNNGFTSFIRDPEIQFDQAGTYSIELSVTNTTGCTNMLTLPLVVVERGPKPILSSLIACENEIITLDPANASMIRVYEGPELQNILFEGNSYDTPPVSMGITYYVTSLDSTYESIPTEVIIDLDGLSVDFEVLVDTLDLNNPNKLIFKNNSQENIFNEWVVDDTFYSLNEAETYTLSNEDQVKIELFVTSSNGCVKSEVQNISISESPVPSVSDMEICSAQTVIIEPGNGNVFYFYEDAALTNLLHKGKYYETGLISGTTRIFITGMDNFRESQPVEQLIEITDFEAVFTASQTLINILESNTVDFMDQSLNAVEWLWDFGNGQTSTDQNPTAIYEQTGTYAVQLVATNSSGCTSTSSVQMVVEEVTGIEDELFDAINIYPNPVSDYLTMETAISLDRIRIIDIYGKIFFTIEQPDHNQIQLSGLPAGLYVLQAEHKGKLVNYKFIKSSR